jgi:hypothetical protein
MSQKSGKDRSTNQVAISGRGNVNQTGRDSTQTTNVNIWISVLLVLALGGLTYLGLKFNMHKGSVDIKIENKQPAQ